MTAWLEDAVAVGTYRVNRLALNIHVLGEPVSQGNIRHLGKGRPAIHQNAARLLPWRNTITTVAHAEKIKAGRQNLVFPLAGPVALHAHFTMKKPKSAPKKRRTFPTTRPDIDHLVRAVGDALTEAGIWADDSQIVSVLTTKSYPGETHQALDVPGVRIAVFQIDPEAV